MLKASMWQYTDSLNELTTSINRLRTNDGKVAHQEEEAPSFFTLFDFPVDKEEDLIRIDEYLHDEKNFNVAVSFYKYLLFSIMLYFHIAVLLYVCYYTLLINEVLVNVLFLF